ncbi:MAG: hypothetical protein ABJC74_05695 [Gemmatimonadota bacterium]
MLDLLRLAIVAAAAVGGFVLTRNFVRNRLRFVEAVRQPWVPWVVGIVVIAIASPVVFFLPLVTKGAALLLGVGTGVGTASGVKALKRGE